MKWEKTSNILYTGRFKSTLKCKCGFGWRHYFHFALVMLVIFNRHHKSVLELCTGSILFVYLQHHPLQVLITRSALCSGTQPQQGSTNIDKPSQWFINKYINLQAMQKTFRHLLFTCATIIHFTKLLVHTSSSCSCTRLKSPEFFGQNFFCTRPTRDHSSGLAYY